LANLSGSLRVCHRSEQLITCSSGSTRPAEVTPDDEGDGTWLISGPGEHFLPDLELSGDVPWFDELRKEQNNFSLGFNRIKSVSAIEALSEIRTRFTQGTLSPDEVPEATYSAGHSLRVRVNRYERDPAARAACLKQFGTACQVCKIDLAAIYGPIASGFIHVHHLTPLASVSGEYRLDPATDLIPICPNCHAVAHLRNPPLTPEEMRVLLRKGALTY
jgi:predicted HNH restriction endonuclease